MSIIIIYKIRMSEIHNIIQKRIPKTYIEISSSVSPETERNMVKKCFNCNTDKYHREYTITYKKNENDEIIGIYRNNKCRKCERNIGETVSSSLESKVEELSRKLSDLSDKQIFLVNKIDKMENKLKILTMNLLNKDD